MKFLKDMKESFDIADCLYNIILGSACYLLVKFFIIIFQ